LLSRRFSEFGIRACLRCNETLDHLLSVVDDSRSVETVRRFGKGGSSRSGGGIVSESRHGWYGGFDVLAAAGCLWPRRHRRTIIRE